jgi:uncharacterized membrane protein
MSKPPAVSAALVVSSTLIGVASGLRSQIGLATVIVGTPGATLPPALRHRAVRPAVVALALGELVVDKLPTTPPRTAPLGLLGRVVTSALAAWLLAPGAGRPAVLRAATAATAAVGAAYGGLAARTALARRVPPLAAALIEDAVAANLAITALRLARTSPRT